MESTGLLQSDKSDPHQAQKLPLVVDLDGTLLKTDSLHEGFVALLSRQPWQALRAIGTLLAHGRAAMKAEIAGHCFVNIDTLPLNDDFLGWLKMQAASGRELYLVSAADQGVVEKMATRIGIFKSCVGSDGTRNLKGQHKAEFLAKMFPNGFAYAGDSAADIAVWNRARAIVLVHASASVSSRAERLQKPIEARFAGVQGAWRPLLRQFRLHQWSKNLLVFVPVILAHRFADQQAWLHSLVAFFALGVTATATYIVNDLVDLQADRSHTTKCKRPIAAGEVSIALACALVPIFLVTGFALAFATGPAAGAVLAAYLALTLAYSFKLKRIALFDTVVLGLLFTLRIVLGAAAADIPLSPWLLAFSVSMFFSLSMAKRQTEIAKKALFSEAEMIVGRGYQASDGVLTLVYGISSGVASLVILMLYTTNSVAAGLYREPAWLWVVPLLLYLWQMRIWLLAHRGVLDDDPIVFALKDKASLALGVGCAIAFYLAL